MPEDFRIALFDGTWEGIRDYYVDPATNGLDWEAIGDEYAPLIIATDNAHEVYELLREMVGRLDDPFTRLLRPTTSAIRSGGLQLRRHRRAGGTGAAGEDIEGLRLSTSSTAGPPTRPA